MCLVILNDLIIFEGHSLKTDSTTGNRLRNLASQLTYHVVLKLRETDLAS